jgi:hypothetical protein
MRMAHVVVMKLCALIIASVTVYMFSVTEPVQAAGIESLIMPGKVIEGHARYEDDCRQCHRLFSKESQDDLCLDCHEDVAEDVSSMKGFHGKSDVVSSDCSNCHTDHKGRDAKVAQFSMETFNHDMTDYDLRGSHIGVACKACHEDGEKFRDAPGQCEDCHSEDDVHKGNLGEICSDCHSEKGWRKEQAFDHDKTDFKLRGKHEDVACNSCHADQQFEDTSTVCNDCHRFNDVHAGHYGAECDKCHRDTSWDKITFDHDKTDFPLTGNHRKVKCDTCHGGDLMAEDLQTECVSCHKNDDEHRGQYGKECKSCHQTSGWANVKFDHGKTDFPLTGGHADPDLLCGACHTGELGNETLGSKCVDCHKTDDVHAGEQGEECDQCHNEEGWSKTVRFEHDMTRFPLIGMHAVAPCEECHLTAVYTEAVTDCNSCHERDDTHERRLGPGCGVCHNPNAWSLWEFDHSEQTSFELDGSHEGIDCHACHKKPVKKKIRMSGSCGGCHREDDIHDGRFSRYCDRCHNTESFDAVEMR